MCHPERGTSEGPLNFVQTAVILSEVRAKDLLITANFNSTERGTSEVANIKVANNIST